MCIPIHINFDALEMFIGIIVRKKLIVTVQMFKVHKEYCASVEEGYNNSKGETVRMGYDFVKL